MRRHLYSRQRLSSTARLAGKGRKYGRDAAARAVSAAVPHMYGRRVKFDAIAGEMIGCGHIGVQPESMAGVKIKTF